MSLVIKQDMFQHDTYHLGFVQNCVLIAISKLMAMLQVKSLNNLILSIRGAYAVSLAKLHEAKVDLMFQLSVLHFFTG